MQVCLKKQSFECLMWWSKVDHLKHMRKHAYHSKCSMTTSRSTKMTNKRAKPLKQSSRSCHFCFVFFFALSTMADFRWTMRFFGHDPIVHVTGPQQTICKKKASKQSRHSNHDLSSEICSKVGRWQRWLVVWRLVTQVELRLRSN